MIDPVRQLKTKLCPILIDLVIALCLCLSLAALLVRAEGDAVRAWWETDPPPEGGWTVGDPIPLRLRVTHPEGATVELPELPKEWEGVEVREQAPIAPKRGDNGLVGSGLDLSITRWAPGNHSLPELALPYALADGTAAETIVRPITITIASVLTKGDEEKRDLKPQAELPRPPIWPWILAGVAAAPLSFWGMRRLRRWLARRRAGKIIEETVSIDDRYPEVIAQEELDRIAGLDLPRHGEFVRHYVLVSGCLRVYVEGIYGVPAMDRTTFEIVRDVASVPLGTTRRTAHNLSELRELLDEADLVKFAKASPTARDAHEALARARAFVENTHPRREERA